MPDLFAPVEIGSLRLPNRIVMVPMSRNRADRSTFYSGDERGYKNYPSLAREES